MEQWRMTNEIRIEFGANQSTGGKLPQNNLIIEYTGESYVSKPSRGCVRIYLLYVPRNALVVIRLPVSPRPIRPLHPR